MKISLLSALVSAAALTGIYASAAPLPSTIVGPITFNWTLLTPKLENSPKYPVPGKTTITGTGFNKTTNIVQVYTSSDKSSPGFGNASFLGLLSNSFAMAFPAGTKLITDGNGSVYVVDHTGTNQIVDVSKVLTVTTTNGISSGVDTVTRATKFSSTNTTGIQSGSGSEFVIVTYDDSAMKTSDGTTTTFQFVGQSTSSSKSTQTTSDNKVVTKGSESFTMHGYGSGTLRGQQCLIQGTIMGTPSGTETFFIPQ